MSQNASNYLEEKLLRHAGGETSFTMPADHYLALHTGDPSETGASNEATGGSYARQALTFEYNSPAIENDALIRFDDLAAGTYSHWSIWDASTSGNCLFKGAFSSSVTVASGSSIEVPANAISITAD